MEYFSRVEDRIEKKGELVLEALLSSNIDTITDLNLLANPSWFQYPETQEER